MGSEYAVDEDVPVRTVHGQAIVRREAGWYVCLNGYLVPPEQRIAVFNRRHLERRNYLSMHQG